MHSLMPLQWQFWSDAVLPRVLARRRTGPFVLVAPFVFAVDSELPTVLDHREAVEAVWVRWMSGEIPPDTA